MGRHSKIEAVDVIDAEIVPDDGYEASGRGNMSAIQAFREGVFRARRYLPGDRPADPPVVTHHLGYAAVPPGVRMDPPPVI